MSDLLPSPTATQEAIDLLTTTLRQMASDHIDGQKWLWDEFEERRRAMDNNFAAKTWAIREQIDALSRALAQAEAVKPMVVCIPPTLTERIEG